MSSTKTLKYKVPEVNELLQKVKNNVYAKDEIDAKLDELKELINAISSPSVEENEE